MWYQVMSALEDEEAQIRGLVHIIYCVGLPGMENSFPSLLTEGGSMMNHLPFFFAALHFCYNDIRLTPAMSLIQLIMAKQSRLRFRTQFGESSGVLFYFVLLQFDFLLAHVLPFTRSTTYHSSLATSLLPTF
jgi:hypothetical protein